MKHLSDKPGGMGRLGTALCGRHVWTREITSSTSTCGLCPECRRIDARRREQATAPDGDFGRRVVAAQQRRRRLERINRLTNPNGTAK